MGEGLGRDPGVGMLSWGCCLPPCPPGRNRGLMLLCVHRSDHTDTHTHTHTHTHTKTVLTVMVSWKRGDN